MENKTRNWILTTVVLLLRVFYISPTIIRFYICILNVCAIYAILDEHESSQRVYALFPWGMPVLWR